MPQIRYMLEYKPTSRIRQTVFYLGKPGIVSDSIIRWAIQHVDGPAHFFGEEHAKYYNKKLSRSMHWLFHAYSGTNIMTILLTGDKYGKAQVCTIKYFLFMDK